MSLLFDFETQSIVPITEGTDRYTAEANPLLAAYSIDGGPVKVWRIAQGEPKPEDLRLALSDPSVKIWAHNAAFDYACMKAFGWLDRFPITVDRIRCSMTLALANRHPGGLDALCRALGVPDTYSKKDGNALIRRFCIPDKAGQFAQWHQYPSEWEKFVEYAAADVEAMRQCINRLPDVMSAAEWNIYAHTLRMNLRGVRIDRELAVQARFQAQDAKLVLKDKARRVLNDDEFNIGSNKAILDLLSAFGVQPEDVRQGTLEKLIESDAFAGLPSHVQEVVRDRVDGVNKSSVTKYAAALRMIGRDDRLRFTIRSHGAGTGRDTATGLQPQNMPRPKLLGNSLSMEEACAIVKAGTAELFFQQPLQLFADTVRGMIIPSAGKALCVADLASIEGTVLPWLAQEQWKIKFYRELFNGKLPYDSYKLAYATAFGVDPTTVSKDQRTQGKPIDLASGYGGNVGALLAFAAVYRVDVDAMAKAAREKADPGVWAECDRSFEFFASKGMDYGLSRDTWAGCYYIITVWRQKHPKTVELWAKCESSFRAALANPGVVFDMAHMTRVQSSAGWVFVQLPSGRLMVYPRASVIDAPNGRKNQLCYQGVNPVTKKGGTIYTYAGKLCENITQSVARDVLFYHLDEVEANNYEVVLRCHDELVAEAPVGAHSGEHLAAIIGRPHAWCEGLPVSAEGYTVGRYQKQ